jgi:hypothetical protein
MYNVPPFMRHASISHAPISKATLSTEPTFEPVLMPRLAGSSNRALVTLACETSTPFGVPVLPVAHVSWDVVT